MTAPAYRPFRPLGTEQLQRFAARLEAAHESWWRHWFQGGPAHPFAAVCEVAEYRPDFGQGAWREYRAGRGAVYLEMPDSRCGEILDAWVGGAADAHWREGIEASAELTQRILGDWIGRVLDSVAVVHIRSATWSNTPPPADLFAPGSGAICATFNTWFGNLLAIFDGDAVQTSQPAFEPRSFRDSRRVPRGRAIQSAEVKLQVSGAASARLSLGALHSLAVGDVMLLEPTVTDPWELATTAGRHVSYCYVGRTGDNRAVVISGKRETQDGR